MNGWGLVNFLVEVVRFEFMDSFLLLVFKISVLNCLVMFLYEVVL